MSNKPKQSEVVKLIADLASQGVYKEVTPQGARNMNNIFAMVAELINELEASEKADEEELALCYDMAVQGADDESI